MCLPRAARSERLRHFSVATPETQIAFRAGLASKGLRDRAVVPCKYRRTKIVPPASKPLWHPRANPPARHPTSPIGRLLARPQARCLAESYPAIEAC
jgi:hypothetical protein